MKDLLYWCDRIDLGIKKLFAHEMMANSSIERTQLTLDTSKSLLTRTREIHFSVERFCRTLANRKIDEQTERAKYLAGWIMANVFLEIDEFVYAYFPDLVPCELRNGNTYVSTCNDCCIDQIGMLKEEWGRKVDELKSVCKAIEAKPHETNAERDVSK